MVTKLVGRRLAGLLHACHWARRMPRYVDRTTRPADHCLLERFVSPGDVCLDIGANAGSWAYPMAKRVGRTGQVHAFDVFPYYALALKRALWLRRIRNVTVHALGLGDRDGNHTIALVDDSGDVLTGTIHLTGDGESPREQAVVPLRRLDTIMSQVPSAAQPVFVKIDVEGAELAIFRGATQMLGSVRPVIYCEVVDRYCRRYGHGLADVLHHLANAGYGFFELKDDGELARVSRRPEHPPHDFVFIPDR